MILVRDDIEMEEWNSGYKSNQYSTFPLFYMIARVK